MKTKGIYTKYTPEIIENLLKEIEEKYNAKIDKLSEIIPLSDREKEDAIKNKKTPSMLVTITFKDKEENRYPIRWFLPKPTREGGIISNGREYFFPYIIYWESSKNKKEDGEENPLVSDLKKANKAPGLIIYYKSIFESYLSKKKTNKESYIKRNLIGLEQKLNRAIIHPPNSYEVSNLNPLVQYESQQKAIIRGKGISKDRFSIVRLPHHTHKGLLDPFQTPESEKIGLDLFFTKEGSMFSLATSLIPFVQHNDGPRIMMGSKNLKQALPLENPEEPIVKSGAENYLGPGRLNLGTNLLVAYMPMDGKTFEDGIVISESAMKKLKSKELDYRIKSLFFVELKNSEKDTKKLKKIKDKIKNVMEKNLGKTYHIGDRLLSLPSKENTLVFIDGNDLYDNYYPGIFKDYTINIYRNAKPHIASLKEGKEGTIIEIDYTFSITKPLEIGDKVTGRHGNKGIISQILPDQEMPYFEINGKRYYIEMAISPCSVIGRKNIGQLIETQLGFLLKFYEEEVKKLKDMGYPLKTVENPELLEELKEITKKAYKEGILATEDGRLHLKRKINGKIEDLGFITAGYQYIVRLNHQAKDKIQARGSKGIFVKESPLTFQPKRGRPDGGQKVGEMEFWALLGHGMDQTIDYFTNKLSNTERALKITEELLMACGVLVEKDEKGYTLRKITVDDIKSPKNDRSVFLVPKKKKDKKDLPDVLVITKEIEELFEGIKTFLDKKAKNDEYGKILKDTKIENTIREVDNFINDIVFKKKGLLRSHLLGRRINRSARAVIIPEPSLSIDEVSLPVDIFLALFDKELKVFGIETKTHFIDNKKEREKISKKINSILKREKFYVFLNRQPTLHLHNMQIFRVKEVNPLFVIKIPPMICGGYNADFDGDTMGVYKTVPGKEIENAYITNNLSYLGNGKDVLTVSKDMVMGLFGLSNKEKEEIVELLERDTVPKNKKELMESLDSLIMNYTDEKSGELTPLGKEKIRSVQKLLFSASTKSKITLNYIELYNLLGEIKDGKTDMKGILEDNRYDVAKIITSGITGNKETLKEILEGIGEIEEFEEIEGKKGIIYGNFTKGLTEDELFILSYRARRTMANKKLSVADAGYFTRLMVEGLYDLKISDDNCKTEKYLKVSLKGDKLILEYEGIGKEEIEIAKEKAKDTIYTIISGRTTKDGEILNYEKTYKTIEKIINGETIYLHSPLTCNSKNGICAVCYGSHPTALLQKKGKPIKKGERIGIMAGEAIGERGTQISMKTFHTGGKLISIKDIRDLLYGKDHCKENPLDTIKELIEKYVEEEGIKTRFVHYESLIKWSMIKKKSLSQIAASEERGFWSLLSFEKGMWKIKKDIRGKGKVLKDLLISDKSKLITGRWDKDVFFKS